MNTLPVTGGFLGWRMVALAFLCTNLVLGFTFGTYGPLVAVIEREYPASRSLFSGGLALVVTLMGLLAPVVGRAITRWSIRGVMGSGLMVLAAMFLLASLARSAWQFVAVFGVLGGVAAACLVIVPPTTLVNRWFVAQRGKATGIVMIPFLVMAMPPLIATVIAAVGWRAALVGLGLVVLLLTPLTRLIVDRPADVGQAPLGGSVAQSSVTVAGLSSPVLRPLRQPVFWAITYSGALVAGTGVTVSTHLVPHATGAGIGLQSAAFLLTVMAAAGMAGGVLFGHIADRIGGARTLGSVCLALTALWPALLLDSSFVSLAIVAAGMGMCVTGFLPVVSTLFANVFGSQSFAQVIGLYSISAMPFGLAMPVLAGWVFDLTGSYRVVFIGFAALLAVACVLLVYVHRVEATPGPIAIPA